VVASLASIRGVKNTTLANRSKRMRWFGAFGEAHGVPDLDGVSPGLVTDFLKSRRASGEPVKHSEQHARLASIRLLYKEGRRLGLASTDPTLDIELPPRAPTHARPFTDAQIAALEIRAVRPGDTRRAVCLALAEATAVSSEIPNIRVSDVDPDTGTVFVHGGRTTDPRVGRLTRWGMAQLRRRLASISSEEGPDPILMGEGRWDHPDEGLAAASMALTGLIRASRLSAPGLNPRSIRAWAGTKALAGGATIDAVARMLGVRSLDQAARIVGFRWLEAVSP
jgi:integrase